MHFVFPDMKVKFRASEQHPPLWVVTLLLWRFLSRQNYFHMSATDPYTNQSRDPGYREGSHRNLGPLD